MNTGTPRNPAWRHKRMAAFFTGGLLFISALCYLIDNTTWTIGVAAYVLISVPIYAVWEWSERVKDRADRDTFTH